MSQPSTLTQEVASSSHRQNNHWQCKAAGSQVRWGIEATANKHRIVVIPPPPNFHSLILWILVAKQISTRKVNVTKRPAFALFLPDLRESYGNPACSDTMEPKKPADWVVWEERKRKHSSTQRGRLGGKNIRHKVNKWANLKRKTVAAVDSFHCLNTWFHFAKKFFRYYVFCPQHGQE